MLQPARSRRLFWSDSRRQLCQPARIFSYVLASLSIGTTLQLGTPERAFAFSAPESPTTSQTALTLREAILRANDADIRQRILALRAQQNQLDAERAWLDLLPTVSFDFSLTRNAKEIVVGDRIVTPLLVPQTALRGTWELWRGERLPNIWATQEQYKSQKIDAAEQLRQLQYDIAVAFLDAAQKQERARFAEEALIRQQKLLKILQTKETAGLATKIDVANAEADALGTEADAARALGDEMAARTVLAVMLDEEKWLTVPLSCHNCEAWAQAVPSSYPPASSPDTQSDTRPDTRPDTQPDTQPDIQDTTRTTQFPSLTLVQPNWLDQDLWKNIPAVVVFEHEKRAAEWRWWGQWLSLLPTVELSGNVRLQEPTLFNPDPIWWSTTVNIRWSLLDGIQTWPQQQSQQLRVEEITAQMQQESRAFRTNAATSFSRWQAASSSKRAQQARRQAAEKAFFLTEKGVSLGTSSSEQWLQAQRQYSVAALADVDAVFSWYAAALAAHRASGVTLGTALRELDL